MLLKTLHLAAVPRCFQNMFWRSKGLQLYWKETPTQVFSCEYCQIFTNSFFIERLRWLLLLLILLYILNLYTYLNLWIVVNYESIFHVHLLAYRKIGTRDPELSTWDLEPYMWDPIQRTNPWDQSKKTHFVYRSTVFCIFFN